MKKHKANWKGSFTLLASIPVGKAKTHWERLTPKEKAVESFHYKWSKLLLGT